MGVRCRCDGFEVGRVAALSVRTPGPTSTREILVVTPVVDHQTGRNWPFRDLVGSHVGVEAPALKAQLAVPGRERGGVPRPTLVIAAAGHQGCEPIGSRCSYCRRSTAGRRITVSFLPLDVRRAQAARVCRRTAASNLTLWPFISRPPCGANPFRVAGLSLPLIVPGAEAL